MSGKRDEWHGQAARLQPSYSKRCVTWEVLFGGADPDPGCHTELVFKSLRRGVS
jgi:hypothetical protein